MAAAVDRLWEACLYRSLQYQVSGPWNERRDRTIAWGIQGVSFEAVFHVLHLLGVSARLLASPYVFLSLSARVLAYASIRSSLYASFFLWLPNPSPFFAICCTSCALLSSTESRTFDCSTRCPSEFLATMIAGSKEGGCVVLLSTAERICRSWGHSWRPAAMTFWIECGCTYPCLLASFSPSSPSFFISRYRAHSVCSLKGRFHSNQRTSRYSRSSSSTGNSSNDQHLHFDYIPRGRCCYCYCCCYSALRWYADSKHVHLVHWNVG